MSAHEDDARFMRRALALAELGAGQVAPNPLVGAVVVRDGVIVGEGFHARFGGDHAEVAALRVAGELARGSTVYVTLEPCNHDGKTPPCTRALIDAGVSRVVFAVSDPNPVAAGGRARLSQAGIETSSDICEREARDLNAPFFFAVQNETRPYVTLKLALSIDGALVDATRTRAWLTGAESRRAVHELRAQVDAIAVGIDTVLADDPELTVRDVPVPRIAPRRVVFDRRARLPLQSKLVRTAGDISVIDVTNGSDAPAEEQLGALGVDVIHAATLDQALGALRSAGVRHLLVEGGATLASSFLAAGLLDRLITFQAPVILGAGALPAFAALPARAVETAPRLRVVARRECGSDLMTTYAVSGD